MSDYLYQLGGDVLGGILNYGATSEANRTNLKIARETNQMQREMFEKQLAYQTQEREASQEYNSPRNQRMLYEAGGFNPYNAVGNINPDTAAQSAPAAPNQHVAQVQPNTAIGDMVSRLGRTYGEALQNESLNLDNQSKRVELRYKNAEKLLTIEEKIADITHKKNLTDQDKVLLDSLEYQRDITKNNLEILDSTKDELKLQEKLRSRMMRLDNRAKQIANDYNVWKSNFEKKIGEKQMELISKQIQEVLSQIALNRSLSAESAARKVLTQTENAGVKLDNQQKRLLRGHVLKMARLEEEHSDAVIELTKYNTGVNGKDWFKLGESLLLPFVGYAAGRAGAVKGAANVKPVNAVPRVPTIYY